MSTRDIFSKLESNGFSVKKYTYPQDLGEEEFPHAVIFNISARNSGAIANSQHANSRKIGGNIVEALASSVAKAFRTNNPAYSAKSSIIGGTTRLDTTIALYLPNTITTGYSVKYNNTDIQKAMAITRAYSSAMPSIVDMYSQMDNANVAEIVGQKIKNVNLEDAKNAGKAMLDNAKSAMVNSIYQKEGMAEALSLYNKVTRTPHMEYILENVDNRTFSFEFTFSPRNEREVRVVHDIIKQFKLSAIPKISSMSGTYGQFLMYPHVFDISMISNGVENTWINKINTSILTDINVDYTKSGKFTTFDDLDGKGTPPTHIGLKLDFTEISILSQQLVEQGY